MLPRAQQILAAITRELERHQRALEADPHVKRIDIQVRIGERSGDPVKITYGAFSENDLGGERPR